jgi:hypothetical protein
LFPEKNLSRLPHHTHPAQVLNYHKNYAVIFAARAVPQVTGWLRWRGGAQGSAAAGADRQQQLAQLALRLYLA